MYLESFMVSKQHIRLKSSMFSTMMRIEEKSHISFRPTARTVKPTLVLKPSLACCWFKYRHTNVKRESGNAETRLVCKCRIQTRMCTYGCLDRHGGPQCKADCTTGEVLVEWSYSYIVRCDNQWCAKSRESSLGYGDENKEGYSRACCFDLV
jgi:hypothetical protein